MSWLYAAPMGLIVLFVALLVAGALDVGHRLSRLVPVVERQVSTVSGPILALIGFLLAFAFAMAGDRYANRRAAIVSEANSMGTFWLRTSLVPEPARSALRARMRRYVELHLEHRMARIDLVRSRSIEAEGARLQAEMWGLVDADSHEEPGSVRQLLVVPALNAMIDDEATVIAARESRLPDALLVYLFVLVTVAGLVLGYRPRDERRNGVLWGAYVIVLGGVLVILLDMDRPRRGLIQSDPTPYLRLRESMRGP